MHFLRLLWMPQNAAVLSQIVNRIHPQLFARCVERYAGHYKVLHFSCWEQFLCLAFAQLSYRESLRDIEACLRSRGAQLYHLGFRSSVARSTLAEANESRDWRIFADLAQALIAKARHAFVGLPSGCDLKENVFALDSTTIDLCLSLFPWAGFSASRAAIKLHTLFELRGAIPSFLHVTEAKCADVNALDWILLEPGAIYVLDRGYVDYARLFHLHRSRAFFVLRATSALRFTRHSSQPVTEDAIRSDQIGLLRTASARADYPEKLRRVHSIDPDSGLDVILLTNHFEAPAGQIGGIYRLRWQVELFFKWIKQHLRIKSFYGRSENAVKTQLWTAVSVYVLVAHLHHELKCDDTLYHFLQILSVNAFAQVPVAELLCPPDPSSAPTDTPNQLILNW